MNNNLCRCGSNKAYSTCCEIFLTKHRLPQTAEQLMRSRYTAFCLNQFEFIVDTHKPSTRSTPTVNELKQSSTHTKWVKLTIHDTLLGGPTDTSGTVSFTAQFNENNEFYELNETSSFIKTNNRWLYVDGTSCVLTINPKLKRNDLCWCQSGKKLKHCHN
jgi:SEC-C motif-containing protein